MKTTLYYNQGTSDKVYEAWLEKTPSGKEAMLYFAFGRRGSILKQGTKTDWPVPLVDAQSSLERLLEGKKRKGYQAEVPVEAKVKKSAKKKLVLGHSIASR